MPDSAVGRALEPAPCLFSRVLCAVAFDHQSASALYNAVGIAAHGGELTVLTVRPEAASRGSEHSEIQASHEKALRDFVSQHIPADLSYGPRLHLHVAYGHPAEAILAAADRYHVDLIIMGTRGRGRVLEGVIGSVAHHVLREARTAVMIVPPFETELVALETSRPIFHVGRVLVPIDPLRENAEQLQVATRLRRISQQPLQLLCVRHDKEPQLQATQFEKLVQQHHLPVDTEAWPVSARTVAAGISESARSTEAGLIVMGLERQQKRMTPGSIAYEVIRHTDAVVLAVPRAEQDSAFLPVLV